MKEQSGGKNKIWLAHRRGSSTLEILIAFAVLMLSLTAMVSISFGNQSMSLDTETNNEALYMAKGALEEARALSRLSFASVLTATVSDSIYTKTLEVSDLTPCRKEVTSRVSWLVSALRPQNIELTTGLTSPAEIAAFGGDCITEPPPSDWDNPQVFADDTINPGKTTDIDVLGKIAYLGSNASPYFYIADTTGAVQGQSGGLFVTFANGFDLDAEPNSLDAIKSGAKTYVFAAVADAVNQLRVIDVTDITNPVLAASRTLSSCVTGSYPEGWRLKVYGDRLYFATRETAGPEFHIFNISDPENPTELGTGACLGTELNTTVNDIAVQDRMIAGTLMRFAYAATTGDNREISVFDVTDPLNTGSATEVVAARQDLGGSQNGASIFLVSNKLYFGRESASGPDLYVYDATDPTAGLSLIASWDAGADISDLFVAGPYAFVATSKPSNEFQVLNVSDLSSIYLIIEYNFTNKVDRIDYETDFVYTNGLSTPNFQILYSP